MGAFLAKQFIFQGFYYDLTRGFPTNAGGRPTMIAFPEGLLGLPKECPKCRSATGLKWVAMNKALLEQRQVFMEHADAIFTQRLAKGEADPYQGFPTCTKTDLAMERAVKRKHKENLIAMPPSTPTSSKTPTLMQYLKRNEVSPDKEGMLQGSKKGDWVEVNYMGFEVDRNALVVCGQCMEDPFQGKAYIRQYQEEVEEAEERKKKKKLDKLGMGTKDCGAGGDQKALIEVSK